MLNSRASNGVWANVGQLNYVRRSPPKLRHGSDPPATILARWVEVGKYSARMRQAVVPGHANICKAVCLPPAAVTDLYIEHLLQPLGLDLTREPKRVKLVRHFQRGLDFAKLRVDGEFEDYQAYQSDPVFKGLDLIVAFIGAENRQAVFEGVYQVGETSPPTSAPRPRLFSQPFDATNHYHHVLKRLQGFEVLVDRAVIDWGPGTRTWHQHFRPETKSVIEVLPRGYVTGFPGYLNFAIGYRDLQKIVSNQVANREWCQALRKVAGVYLILDTGTGRQYVGSAYGQAEILGRWEGYVATEHGGNKLLKELIQSDPGTLNRLQFSILQTVDRASTMDEVLSVERMQKVKLGSRVYGLNAN